MSARINPIPASGGKVWFIQNMTREGPGYFGELLKRWKIPFSACDLECGDKLPRVRDKDAVIVLGGEMSANDKTETMRSLLRWIQSLLEREIPYLGICLGLQTLVKAAGGQVEKSPVKEIGFKMADRTRFVCQLTREGRMDPLLDSLPKQFPIFQLHGETVSLTNKMKLLAEGEWCRNQIVRAAPKAYGLQGHLEIMTTVLKHWLKEDADLNVLAAGPLLKEWQRVKHDMHLHCRTVLLNFLKIAGLVG